MKRVLVICAVALAITATQAYADVKPYGFVLFNGQFNSSWNGDIPVKATEYSDETANFLMTARQTRLGMKIKLDNDFDASGKLEFDFFGLRGSSAAGGVLQSAPRLRLAFMSMKFMDGCLKLTIGQDWVKAFAPLNPTSIAHVSIPEFSSSGNLWNRMPQIRADFYREIGPGKLTVQVAAVRPFGADLNPHDPYGSGDQHVEQGDALGAGELAVIPFGQARVAYSHGKLATVGVSGHFGRMDYSKRDSLAFGWREDLEKTNTYAVAADVKVNAGMISFMGEGFWGQALSTYFSSLGVGYVPDLAENRIIQIQRPKGLGGWGQLTVKATPILKINAGAGLEMYNKDDLSAWDGWVGSVGQNMTFFGNVMCSAIDGCVFSLEYGMIQTKKIIDADAGAAFEADWESDAAVNHSVNLGFMMKF